jgi:hypothetical protein
LGIPLEFDDLREGQKQLKIPQSEVKTNPLTFGTNTSIKVAVVQKMMKIEISMKTASFWSDSTKAIAAPITHMMKTL